VSRQACVFPITTPDRDAAGALIGGLNATMQMWTPLTSAPALRWLGDGSIEAWPHPSTHPR
jgi:hypothetical protein